MVPVFGYIPAIIKVGLLLFLLNHRLKSLEAMLPEIHGSPEASLVVGNALGSYHRKIPQIWLTRSLRQRLGRIIGLEKPGQQVPSAPPDSASRDTSISTQIPK